MIPFKNIRELWENQVKKYGDKIVLFCVDEGKEISYKEMYKQINKTANLLLELDVNKGDKVALITSNIPEFFYVFYGCLNIGAVIVPINYSSAVEEIKHLINFSDSRILFVEDQFYDKVKNIKIKKIKIRDKDNEYHKADVTDKTNLRFFSSLISFPFYGMILF